MSYLQNIIRVRREVRKTVIWGGRSYLERVALCRVIPKLDQRTKQVISESVRTTWDSLSVIESLYLSRCPQAGHG